MTPSADPVSFLPPTARRVAVMLAFGVVMTLCPAAHGRVWVDTGPLGSGSTLPLVLDPSNPATIYTAASNTGVRKSTDGGQSWSAANNGLPVPGSIYEIAIDPSTPTTLYVAMPSAGVFKSIDGGGSWVAVNDGLPAQPEAYSIAIDPSDPSIVYAGLEDDELFKSTNGGDDWSPANVGVEAEPPYATDAYIYALAVDPSDPGTVYAGLLQSRRGLFKSTDGGASWQVDDQGLPDYADVHEVVFDPSDPNTIYLPTSNGLYKRTGGSGSWDRIRFPEVGAASLAVDPSQPDTIYIGAQGRLDKPGGVYLTRDGGLTWGHAGLGFRQVYALQVDPSNPATVYAGTFGGSFGTGVHVLRPGCAAAPIAGCIPPEAPGAARLSIQSTGQGRLTWSSTTGPGSDFGEPLFADDPQYTLCLYDGVAGVPSLVLEASVPAGGGIAGLPWKLSGTKLKYRARAPLPEGVQKIDLRSGLGAADLIKLKGKGNLALPPLPLQQDPAVTVQLVNTEGNCWAATYASAITNDGATFKAVSSAP